MPRISVDLPETFFALDGSPPTVHARWQGDALFPPGHSPRPYSSYQEAVEAAAYCERKAWEISQAFAEIQQCLFISKNTSSGRKA